MLVILLGDGELKKLDGTFNFWCFWTVENGVKSGIWILLEIRLLRRLEVLPGKYLEFLFNPCLPWIDFMKYSKSSHNEKNITQRIKKYICINPSHLKKYLIKFKIFIINRIIFKRYKQVIYSYITYHRCQYIVVHSLFKCCHIIFHYTFSLLQ